MKKIVAMGVVMAVLVFAALASAQQAKGPKIEAKELKFNFGKVVQGTQAAHVFEVRNTGTAPLIIEKVQTS
jgi:Protein of unknown function (DUF1573)